MSKKQTNDQGYRSVMKEYDFYNNDNDDFEIIDEIPTNYINTTSNNNINNSLKNSEIEKQKGKLNKFIIKLFKIIFNSRNKLSEFDSKSKPKLNENIKTNNTFTFDIEELIAYDSFKDMDDNNDNNRQQYIIDFFLYDNNDDDLGSLKSVRVKASPKLLVERWKIKFFRKIFSYIRCCLRTGRFIWEFLSKKLGTWIRSKSPRMLHTTNFWKLQSGCLRKEKKKLWMF